VVCFSYISFANNNLKRSSVKVLLPLKKNIFIKLLSNYGAKHLLKMFLTEDEVLMGKRH